MATTEPAPVETEATEGLPKHTRTLVLGLLLLSGANLTTVVAALAAGIPLSDASFIVPFILAPAIGAGLAARFGTWSRVLGLVIGLATVAMTFFFIFGLFVPYSPIEFIVGIAYALGVVAFLVGGVGSLIRRADLHAEPTDGERRWRMVTAGLLVLGVVVSVPMFFMNRSTVDDLAAEGRTVVEASNFEYEDATAAAGEEIIVHNADPFVHTFTIDALDIDVELLPGDSVAVALPAEAGSYTYYCIPHSFEQGEAEDDMAATLTIE